MAKATGDARKFHRAVRLCGHLGAQCSHAGQGAVRIGTSREVGKPGRPLGQAGEQRISVRDGLIAGENEGALNGLMTWDIKAKRKMEELDQAYGLCLTALNSGRTLQVWARTLIALP